MNKYDNIASGIVEAWVAAARCHKDAKAEILAELIAADKAGAERVREAAANICGCIPCVGDIRALSVEPPA